LNRKKSSRGYRVKKRASQNRKTNKSPKKDKGTISKIVNNTLKEYFRKNKKKAEMSRL